MSKPLLLAGLLALCSSAVKAAGWADLPASVPELARVSGAVPPPPPPEAAKTIICVDAGHPNTFNSGTAPQNGTNETHINWLVALELEAVLKEKGYAVLMTKSAELEYVENKQRAQFCNAGGAALAVHLHCESTPGTGFALYYPDRVGTYDYGDDPDNGFRGPSDLVRADSRALAEAAAAGMEPALAGSLKNRGVYGDSRTAVGSRQGALTFSIFSKIPTLTIEMAVLSNPRDAAFMKTEAGRQKMADAIAAGIMRYRAP